MSGAAALPGAVSVRYAREQYALGYAQGRAEDEVDPGAALAFARFFAARCEGTGELVDVHDAYRAWEATR